MIDYDIRIDDQRITAALDRLIQEGADRTALMRAAGENLVSNVLLGFDQGVSPYGEAWDPPKYRDGQPLRDSDRLRNSIEASLAVTPETAELGTNVCYGVVHQFGATIEATPGAAGTTLCGTTKTGAKALHWTDASGAHHFAKRVVIPPREFLPLDGLPGDWESDLIDVLEQKLLSYTG